MTVLTTTDSSATDETLESSKLYHWPLSTFFAQAVSTANNNNNNSQHYYYDSQYHMYYVTMFKSDNNGSLKLHGLLPITKSVFNVSAVNAKTVQLCRSDASLSYCTQLGKCKCLSKCGFSDNQYVNWLYVTVGKSQTVKMLCQYSLVY